MDRSASDIARRLADNAEAVCRRYLSNGHREGRYWLVGDIRNAPGRSLYVRLSATDGGGAAGKWTDAASGEHGDLLDLIAGRCGHVRLRDTLAEARHFLSLPAPPGGSETGMWRWHRKGPTGSVAAAERLWAASKSIDGTFVASYLGARDISRLERIAALRFHPQCFYRPTDEDAPGCRRSWPAMIAAVTDEEDRLAGVHRTWLAADGSGKAAVANPRRAMGNLLGHGVRFGASGRVMAAGEGIETLLSLREILPALPSIAGLSAAHLAAIAFPRALERLYVARDADPAGAHAFARLAERAGRAGIEVVGIEPRHDDFNHDLQTLGPHRMATGIRAQLVPGDRHLLPG